MIQRLVFETPPELRVYLEMSKDDGARDCRYLFNFSETLVRLHRQRDGFVGADIEAVEAAWCNPDFDLWSGGFVVKLHNGRRAHIVSHAYEEGWDSGSEVVVEMLPAGQEYPVWDSHCAEPPQGWKEVPELAHYLARLQNYRAGSAADTEPSPRLIHYG